VTAVSKAKPQVIDDEEHERVHERVAAVDVAKDTGMVCTRLPHPSRPGARQSTVWTVRARMAAIRALGRQLVRDGIEVVTLESTSDYWRIWFFVLEACGLAVQLVSAAQAKNLPGRPKTDLLTELPGVTAGHKLDRSSPEAAVPSRARLARPQRECGPDSWLP
jgi:transposase